jgi:hypothetical protein
MSPSLHSLVLSPLLRTERVLLVRVTDAVRLCREGGHESLPTHQALPYLDGLTRDALVGARAFAHQSQLLDRSLADCADAELLACLRRLVSVGTLTVVRETEAKATGETRSLVAQRGLIRALEKGGRQGLKFEGRTYRLVADADLDRLRDRESYEVVSRSQAQRVLDSLAKVAPPAKAETLQKASTQLTRDWRPPLWPDGLILLRKIPVRESIPKQVELPRGPRRGAGGATATEEAPVDEVENVCRPCADLAQAQQAAVLAQASQGGMPFCEPCAGPSSATI